MGYDVDSRVDESVVDIMVALDSWLLAECDEFYWEHLDDVFHANSRRVADRYEIVLLGAGVEGYVLRVDDVTYGTTFALKVGHMEKGRTNRVKISDGLVGLSLSSVYEIVNVYGFDDRFCLMEYISGECAGEYTDEELIELGYIDDMERVIREVYALGYAVIDLHPDNVIVDESRRFRVFDMGLYEDVAVCGMSVNEVLNEFWNDSAYLIATRDRGSTWYSEWE